MTRPNPIAPEPVIGPAGLPLPPAPPAAPTAGHPNDTARLPSSTALDDAARPPDPGAVEFASWAAHLRASMQ